MTADNPETIIITRRFDYAVHDRLAGPAEGIRRLLDTGNLIPELVGHDQSGG